jgi:hypothetical protein
VRLPDYKQTLRALAVIDQYGDLTDVNYLQSLQARVSPAVKRRVQRLLNATYAYKLRYIEDDELKPMCTYNLNVISQYGCKK